MLILIVVLLIVLLIVLEQCDRVGANVKKYWLQSVTVVHMYLA